MNTIQPEHSQPGALPLWMDGEIESSALHQPEEICMLENGLRVIRNVSQPALTAYLPDPAAANGTAVIVCPGGAYHFQAFEHEGIDVARWLNERGIAAFLLKYRLFETGNDFPQCVGKNLDDPQIMARIKAEIFPRLTEDGCQAIRMVRERAEEWRIHPARVGLMGFSAGGMLTLNVSLHHDPQSRPDFAAPIYAAPPPDAPVPEDAPPLFLLCAADDEMASAVSTQYYSAWRSAGKPVELHIYAQGGHGFGMNAQGLPADHWIERFAEWLEASGFLPAVGG